MLEGMPSKGQRIPHRPYHADQLDHKPRLKHRMFSPAASGRVHGRVRPIFDLWYGVSPSAEFDTQIARNGGRW